MKVFLLSLPGISFGKAKKVLQIYLARKLIVNENNNVYCHDCYYGNERAWDKLDIKAIYIRFKIRGEVWEHVNRKYRFSFLKTRRIFKFHASCVTKKNSWEEGKNMLRECRHFFCGSVEQTFPQLPRNKWLFILSSHAKKKASILVKGKSNEKWHLPFFALMK